LGKNRNKKKEGNKIKNKEYFERKKTAKKFAKIIFKEQFGRILAFYSS
jgi:hypothetical protein